MAPATSQLRWFGLLAAAGVVRLTYMGRTGTCMKVGSALFEASVLPSPQASPRLYRILLPDVPFRRQTKSCASDVTQTASRSNGRFDPSQLMQGVSCEGCHGPGSAHVSLAESGSETPGLIFNPSHLPASQSVDFCGACHRTWWDVVGKYSDVGAIRFPAYRLEGSRCWQEGDARLTCIACHDPHQPLVQDSAAYDDKCLACHQSRKETHNSSTRAAAQRCPVGTSACATCHMAKYEIPGMHLTFTDHKIRIVHGTPVQIKFLN